MRLNSKIVLFGVFLLSLSLNNFSQVPAGALMDAPSEDQLPAEETLPSSTDIEPSVGEVPSFSESESAITSKHIGPPSILISRPVYAPYSEESKTMYIASISEAYFHFKLSGLNGHYVYPIEKTANSIPYFRDFTRRISRNAYIESARQFGASYLFYQEYEPQGKKVRFNIELYSIGSNKRLLSKNIIINLQQLETGLDECVAAVVNALKIDLSESSSEFLTTPILGTNPKVIETLGNSFASAGNLTQKKAAIVADEFIKIANDNKKMPLAKYIAASICSRAGKHEKAISFQSDLVATFGSQNPSLYFDLAAYYKASGNYNDALDAIDRISSKDPSYNFITLSERAGIYEAKGDLNKAQSDYEKVLSEDNENGAILFKLALVNTGLNNLSAASNYLSKAERSGYKLDKSSYFDLGMRYNSLGNANDKAIDAFKMSLTLQQDYEDAWQELAKTYLKMNRQNDAAECYVNLFQINNEVYKDDLLKAAELYEEINMTDKVKDVYSLYLARKFVNPTVSVKLALLEAKSGNCEKAMDLVFNLNSNSSVAAEVQEVNKMCGKPERRVVVQDDDQLRKSSPAVVLWRIISGVLLVGGAGAGYYLDTQIADKQKAYQKSYNLNEIDKLHNDIKNFTTLRNASYGVAAAGGVSLALSITIPIIRSK